MPGFRLNSPLLTSLKLAGTPSLTLVVMMQPLVITQTLFGPPHKPSLLAKQIAQSFLVAVAMAKQS
jgi:hypothetical protein